MALWSLDVFVRTSRFAQGIVSTLSGRAGLRLESIVVEGRSRASSAEIAQALGVEKGISIFDLDPHFLREKLESLAWVRSAIVERRLPNTLYVRLMERVPVALWQDEQGRTFLVDERGVTIKEAPHGQQHSFLIVTGKDAAVNAPELVKHLAKYPLVNTHVTGASFISMRQWELVIDGRLRVKLPEDNLNAALARVQEFAKTGYFEKQEILSIDVRLPDRAFFYLTQDVVARRKGAKKQKEIKDS